MPSPPARWRLLWILFVALGLGSLASAQTATVRGFVNDARNQEPLQGVNVALIDGDGDLTGASTNGDGAYSVSGLLPGVYLFRASYIGYATFRDTLTLGAGRTEILSFSLTPSASDLDEVVVQADVPATIPRSTAGLQQIQPSDIARVPSPDVSGDLIVYLTAQPGVVTLGDRGGQLFVRGGEPSHNLVLLDGMTIYQPFHVLGFYSALPSDILNRADFYTAGFGSRFTGRISSVLDVYTRNGDKRNHHAAVSAAPFISSVLIEGPLVDEKVSIIGSLRESVIEQGADRYIRAPLPYHFGDRFAKIHWSANANNQFALSAVHTYDRGTLGGTSDDRVLEEIRWSNFAVGVRYIFLPRSVPFIGEVLLSYSHLRSEAGPSADPVRRSEIGGLSYTVNMTNFIRNVEWKWGLFWRAPEIHTTLGGAFQNVEFGFSRRHKAGLYLEPNFRLDNGLQAQVGLIAQMFPGQSNRAFAEPRARFVWEIGRHELSTAVGMYHQEIFGFNDRRDATNIFTAWRSPPVDRLARSEHALAGYRYNFGPNFALAVEGFYKGFRNIYIAEWSASPRFVSALQPADGRARGVDVRLDYAAPTIQASLSYGLSSVFYRAKQPSLELWYGEELLRFRPPHDRRHQLNAMVSGRLSGFDLSARWNLGSGRPYNRVFGFDGILFMNGVRNVFDDPDERRVIYDRPFEGLLPAYHRLDLSVQRGFRAAGVSWTAQASVINVYDRRNLFALDTFTQERTDQLPFLPSFGLRAEF